MGLLPRPYKELERFQLVSFLKGNIELARMRAAQRHRTAVPGFHTDGIGLFLPLCLKDENPTLALAIERKQDHYRASALVPLDLAYASGRLLGPLDSDWLQIERVDSISRGLNTTTPGESGSSAPMASMPGESGSSAPMASLPGESGSTSPVGEGGADPDPLAKVG